MSRFQQIVLVLTVGFATAASADTIQLANGTSLDGKVSYPNDNCIALEMGGGTIVFQKEEVEKVEINDRAATVDASQVNPLSQMAEAEMAKRTGLSAGQREQIIAMLEQLRAEDQNERAVVFKRLVAMQSEVDVFGFLEKTLDSYGARVLPHVLELMVAIDKEHAAPVVQHCVTDAVPGNRAAALSLMGKVKGMGSIETLARGLVDIEPDVRVAAATALAELGNKSATPALIECARDNDARVRNASMTALSKIWSSDDTLERFDTADQWERFWSERSGTVGSPVKVATLKPLYEPEPGYYLIVHE